MTPPPFFSVIMPVFNGAEFLERSVGSLLLQTDRDWELLAVDDGSVDDSVGVLDRFTRSDPRIHVDHSSRSGGPARPRNVGLARARGEVICFLDQDDEWLPHKLARQREKFASGSFGLVYSDALVDFHGERQLWSDRWGPLVEGRVPRELIDHNFVPAVTAAVPAQVAREIGEFDEQLSGADDYDYWLRIAFAGHAIGLIDEPLAVWWYRDHNLSNSQVWHARRVLRCLRKHARRQRPHGQELRVRIRATRGQLFWAALHELRHGSDNLAARRAAMTAALASARTPADLRHVVAAIRARTLGRRPPARGRGQ